MNAETKIFEISKLLLSITDEEWIELKEIVREQEEYVHPLKYGKQAKYHALAQHNKKMLDCLERLKQTIIEGEPVSKL